MDLISTFGSTKPVDLTICSTTKLERSCLYLAVVAEIKIVCGANYFYSLNFNGRLSRTDSNQKP